jgi:hypothetical protein
MMMKGLLLMAACVVVCCWGQDFPSMPDQFEMVVNISAFSSDINDPFPLGQERFLYDIVNRRSYKSELRGVVEQGELIESIDETNVWSTTYTLTPTDLTCSNVSFPMTFEPYWPTNATYTGIEF